jgi:hypothetical protein
VNIILYKQLNSKHLSDVLGNLYSGGCYKTVTRWLETYAENHPPISETDDDIVLGVDNEQKSGHTYTSSIESTLIMSCITVVILFILKLKRFYQYVKNGCTSNWRFPQKDIDKKEKENILEAALDGREKGLV